MIKQLGLEDLIFFTFSATDLHWPELHRIIPSNSNCETLAKCHNQNIVDNPHIAV